MENLLLKGYLQRFSNNQHGILGTYYQLVQADY